MAREAPPTARTPHWRPFDPRDRPQATLGAWFRGGDWSHRMVIVTFLLGLTIGGVAFSATDLRPELEGVRKDLAGWQAFAGAQQRQIEDLASDNAELTAQLEAKEPVPDLRGSTQEAVEALAEGFGWQVVVRERESGKGVGTVLSQDPPAGTLMHLGARLTIVVATPLGP